MAIALGLTAVLVLGFVIFKVVLSTVKLVLKLVSISVIIALGAAAYFLMQ